jgi:hypothetical protein
MSLWGALRARVVSVASSCLSCVYRRLT